MTNLVSQKMGIHEWSYDNDISLDLRYKVPLRDHASRSRTSRPRSNSASTAKLAYAETQRCLNCDVQTVFTRDLCIECDACVDICPMDCITFTANGAERSCARPHGAGAEPDAGPLRLRHAQDRPRHGQGRGRLPPLRPLRRALPHRRLGHAEVPARYGARQEPIRMPARLEADERLRRQVRQRQRLGLGERQPALRHARSCGWACRSPRGTSSRPTSRACRPGTRCGSPRRATAGRRGGVDLMVAMNPQTWDKDIARSSRRLPVLRLDPADAGVAIPRRHQRGRRAATAICNEHLHRSRGSGSCSRTSSMSGALAPCSGSRSARSRG